MKSRIILLITVVWLGWLSTASAILQWPLTVTNIAELKSITLASAIAAEKAYTTPTSPSVYVLGYYTPGDRGGGMFEWDPNASATSDDGRYISTNGWSSGNGRWVRRLNGEVANVQMWGAKSDGVSECSAQVQRAMDQCQDGAFSGQLIFPNGSYLMTNTVVFNSTLRISGEGLNTLIYSQGTNDVFRTRMAQFALTGQPFDLDHGLIFENMQIFMDTNATGNAGLAVCSPGEAAIVRNLIFHDGGYGIRVFGGGAPGLQISQVHVSDEYVAGVSVEGFLPNGTWVGAFSAMNLTSLSGDHRRADSDATASLLRIEKCYGACSVYDFKAEGSWGGGLFYYNRSLAGTNDDGQLGTLRIFGGSYNCGGSDCDLVVLRSQVQRTASVLINPLIVFNIRHLIRDEISGRNIDPALYDAADSLGNNQNLCRLPIQYEGYANYSRFLIGNTALVAFVPTVTNAWYRIMPQYPAGRLGGRLIISSINENSEISFDELIYGGSTGAAINVIRATRDNGNDWRPAVTQARVGSYHDASGNYNSFVDIYVERIIPFGQTGGNPKWAKISVAYPLDYSLNEDGGTIPLMTPTAPLTDIVPAGCTLVHCATNSLVR